MDDKLQFAEKTAGNYEYTQKDTKGPRAVATATLSRNPEDSISRSREEELQLRCAQCAKLRTFALLALAFWALSFLFSLLGFAARYGFHLPVISGSLGYYFPRYLTGLAAPLICLYAAFAARSKPEGLKAAALLCAAILLLQLLGMALYRLDATGQIPLSFSRWVNGYALFYYLPGLLRTPATILGDLRYGAILLEGICALTANLIPCVSLWHFRRKIR